MPESSRDGLAIVKKRVWWRCPRTWQGKF
jgi:hypothetical protein